MKGGEKNICGVVWDNMRRVDLLDSESNTVHATVDKGMNLCLDNGGGGDEAIVELKAAYGLLSTEFKQQQLAMLEVTKKGDALEKAVEVLREDFKKLGKRKSMQQTTTATVVE